MKPDLSQFIEPYKVREIFRAYYINGYKIDEYFTQNIGAIRQFTKTHGKEVAFQAGGSIGSSQAMELVSALAGSLTTNAEISKRHYDETEYEFTTITKLNILRTLWNKAHLIINLDSETNLSRLSQHDLVTFVGNYRMVEKPIDLSSLLTDTQIDDLSKQLAYEVRNERSTHQAIFIQLLQPVITIISNQFVTYVGQRYLPHNAETSIPTRFICAIIGMRNGTLYLDPIAIGSDVSRDK